MPTSAIVEDTTVQLTEQSVIINRSIIPSTNPLSCNKSNSSKHAVMVGNKHYNELTTNSTLYICIMIHDMITMI